MNTSTRYRLAEGVAIRPERFGGLVYHYQRRSLYFLHSHPLAEFVGGLTGELPLARAIDAFCEHRGLAPEAGEAMLAALGALEKLGVVVPVAA